MVQDTGELTSGTIRGLDAYVADDGRTLLVRAGNDSLVYRCDAVTGHLIDESRAGMSVAVIPGADGRVLLASGTEDGDISLRAV